MTPQEKLAARIKQATRLTWDDCATLTTSAHARFETFAAVDASDEQALARLDPVDAMQARLARWQARNFIGIPSSTQLVCGIAEELAEWGAAENDTDEGDAIGDVLVYCSQLCTKHRLSLDTLMTSSLVPSILTGVGAAVGLLSHVALKGEQGIRGLGDRSLARVGVAAGVLLIAKEVDYLRLANRVFLATAKEVLRRDWIANPDGPVQA